MAIKNSVGFCYSVSLFVIRNFSGTCSSVEMLKGYMVRERLGNPALGGPWTTSGSLSRGYSQQDVPRQSFHSGHMAEPT